MSEEMIKIIFDFIKEISWPLVVFIIFCQLKSEIKALINRIKNISAGGVTVNISDQQQEITQDKERNKKLAKEIAKYKNIQNKLLELQERTSKDKNIYELLYHFEKTYRLIFGSQLNILTFIFRSSSQKISKALTEAIYRRTIFVGTYPFDLFIGFLLNSQLIKYNDDDTYFLTQLGFLFLEFITINNLPLNKPF